VLSKSNSGPISIAVMNKMANKFLGGTENSLAAAVAASQQRTAPSSGSTAMAKPLSGMALVVSSLPLQQQVALLAVQHIKSTKDILLPLAFDKYKQLCKVIRTTNQDIAGFASLCATLESNGLLRVVGGTTDAKKRKVSCLVSVDDSVRALGTHVMLKQVLPPTAQ
jgi:Cdc6-like AAA superfamily ATPase